MSQFLLFLLLGLGAGSAYALLANGVVAIYKGSGVLNFAQGAIAMLATFCYVAVIEAGVSKYLALAIVVAGSAAAGVIISTGVFRPLRAAPPLGKVVATLGILVALQALALVIWGSDLRQVPSLFPTDSVALFGGTSIGVDRFYLLGTVVVVTTALCLLYARTRFGLATRAAAENESAAGFLGISPGMVSAVNWALGCALAALAGALIAPLTSLDNTNLTLAIFPALAAALVGRFSSFAVTATAAVAIGCGQSLLTNYWDQPGVQAAAPFIIVIAVMALSGKGLPGRGGVEEGRPPISPSGRLTPVPIVIGVVGTILLLVFASQTYQAAIILSIVSAILALSLVVVVGYVGQVSVMQMSLAGLGGLATAKLASGLGIPFPLSILVGAALVVPVGVVLGLPALRVRGLNLAVVTLGAAIALDAMFFGNPDWTGGLGGAPVPAPSMFSTSFDPVTHPVRFGVFALVVLALAALLVSNIRRGAVGRRMLAVRGNERAAAMVGISNATTKLQAFAISTFIAALGGGVIAYTVTDLTFGRFAVLQSVNLITIAYLGGIASITGAMVAGFIASGGVLYTLLNGIGGFDEYYMAVSGVLVVWAVIFQPDGAAVLAQRELRRLTRRRGRHDPHDDEDARSEDRRALRLPVDRGPSGRPHRHGGGDVRVR